METKMNEHVYKEFTIITECVSGLYVWYIKYFPRAKLQSFEDEINALNAAKKFINLIWANYQSSQLKP